MKTTINIQYLGVMRLLLKRREDKFEFLEPPTLQKFMEDFESRYGYEAKEECLKQMLLLYEPESAVPKPINYPKDKEYKIENESLIKIMSFITGG